MTSRFYSPIIINLSIPLILSFLQEIIPEEYICKRLKSIVQIGAKFTICCKLYNLLQVVQFASYCAICRNLFKLCKLRQIAQIEFVLVLLLRKIHVEMTNCDKLRQIVQVATNCGFCRNLRKLRKLRQIKQIATN